MKQWYMTVGYPGGEYAAQAETGNDFAEILGTTMDIEGSLFLRPCPPDLVAWIENRPPGTFMSKTSGGWLFSFTSSIKIIHPSISGEPVATVATSTFIPVAGAAGLTVLPAAVSGAGAAGLTVLPAAVSGAAPTEEGNQPQPMEASVA